jgi:tellurite resistance protein
MIHVASPGTTAWCENSEDEEVTDDPRDATCSACLRIAAAYGAAAAMRYAAVENGATRDPELVRERDEAIRRLNAICDALEEENAFFCHDCERMMNTCDRGLHVPPSSWCVNCAKVPA